MCFEDRDLETGRDRFNESASHLSLLLVHRGSVISPGVSNLIVVLVTSPLSHACQSML